jgi:hypothetical protein
MGAQTPPALPTVAVQLNVEPSALSAQHWKSARPQSAVAVQETEQTDSVPNPRQMPEAQAAGPSAVQSSPMAPCPARQDPLFGRQNAGAPVPVPSCPQVNPSGQAEAPDETWHWFEQNFWPLKGQFVQLFTRQLPPVAAQSSSVLHAAQREPSVFGVQVRVIRLQVAASPHSRSTSAAAVLSQYPMHVPEFGTHTLGPLPIPERSLQLKFDGQSELVLQLVPQNCSCEARFWTQALPPPPHSKSSLHEAQSPMSGLHVFAALSGTHWVPVAPVTAVQV